MAGRLCGKLIQLMRATFWNREHARCISLSQLVPLCGIITLSHYLNPYPFVTLPYDLVIDSVGMGNKYLGGTPADK
jgi:hypothetical protein